jgi:hypothetical protein
MIFFGREIVQIGDFSPEVGDELLRTFMMGVIDRSFRQVVLLFIELFRRGGEDLVEIGGGNGVVTPIPAGEGKGRLPGFEGLVDLLKLLLWIARARG